MQVDLQIVKSYLSRQNICIASKIVLALLFVAEAVMIQSVNLEDDSATCSQLNYFRMLGAALGALNMLVLTIRIQLEDPFMWDRLVGGVCVASLSARLVTLLYVKYRMYKPSDQCNLHSEISTSLAIGDIIAFFGLLMIVMQHYRQQQRARTVAGSS